MLIAVILCPTLVIGTSAEAWDGKTVSTSLKGTGSAEDPILIESAADLAYLSNQVNKGTSYEGKYITQTADIDLGGKEWTPIGHCSDDKKTRIPFSGVYDGKNHKVTGLSIKSSYALDTGLFGYVSSTAKTVAGIANLTVEGEIRLDAPKSVGVGGLVGRICREEDVGLKEIYVINCTSNVDITIINCANQPRVGGVFGYCNLTTVENVINNGSISVKTKATSRIGGIFGEITSSTVLSCVNNGDITATVTSGNAQTGGIAGMIVYWPKSGRKLILGKCINNGDVSSSLTTGKCYTAGVVGGFYSDDKKAMDVLVVDCVNTGAISSVAEKSSYYPYTGGIYAYASYPKTAIVRCVNVGKITSTGGLDERAGDIISVMNNPSEKTLFCLDCVALNNLSAYIVNDKTGCIEKIDETLAFAAARSLSESIIRSVININGFHTSGIPAEPDLPLIIETKPPVEASKNPEAGLLGNTTTEQPKDEDPVPVAAITCIIAAVICCCIVPAVARRSKKN